MSSLREWIPVNSILNDKDEFVSLKDFSEKPIKPNPFEGADSGRSEYAREYKLSTSFSSKLEIAAIGGVNSELGATTFVHDSVIYKLSRAPIQDGNDIVLGTWWGYGIRIKILIKNIQFGLNVNWNTIAATAQMGYADAEFEVESIGISDAELFKLLPSPTDLDMDSLNEILEAGNKIRSFIHANDDPSDVIYKPLRIEIDKSTLENIDPISDDRHLIFTYQKIRKRTKLKYAKKEAIKNKLNPELIAKFYEDFFNISDEHERPSRSNRREARDWLKI